LRLFRNLGFFFTNHINSFQIKLTFNTFLDYIKTFAIIAVWITPVNIFLHLTLENIVGEFSSQGKRKRRVILMVL